MNRFYDAALNDIVNEILRIWNVNRERLSFSNDKRANDDTTTKKKMNDFVTGIVATLMAEASSAFISPIDW